MTEDSDEVVHCYQCGWAMRRGEPFTVVMGLCPDCGNIEPMGVIHSVICLASQVAGEDRVTTQHRRLVAMRVN